MPDQDTEYCEAPAAFWPVAMERKRVPDAAFARAYAKVPDRDRALLKTGIAAIYAAYGGPLPAYRRQEAGLGHDLRLIRQDVPLDFAVVLCGASFASPARLAAAVIPALCARVPEVAAVRVGTGNWPHALLTTLELCGVETACQLGPRSLAGLWEELPHRGRGAVILLDGVPFPDEAPEDHIQLFRALTTGKAGIFCDPDAPVDREALCLAQPDMAFSLYGDREDADWGESFAPVAGGLAEAADCGYDALYVGQNQLEQALGAAPLVLGAGRETFWLWPQLFPDVFRRVVTAAAVDTRRA